MEKVLIIGTVFPEPASSAAGNRMMQLIAIFLRQGWQITFASPAAESGFSADLGSLGIGREHILLNDPSFDDWIAALQPTIVLFDRFMTEEQFGWRVAEQCPSALRVLDTEDLHCLRQARAAAWKAQRAFTLTDLFSDTAKREIASILRCDISLMISRFEMQLLRETFRIESALLHYIPLFAAAEKDPVPYEEREHFLFIGNFLHEPNLNAVHYLKDTIWPLIRKLLPKAELQVYGAYPSPKVTQLQKAKEGFYIRGRAEDALEVTRKARVSLAPLRFGAGIKGKLLEAMVCGTPNVTTGIGAEGMHGTWPWNGVITDDPKAFARAAATLYTDREAWTLAQQNGYAILESEYDRLAFETGLIDRLKDLKSSLEKHRLSNFTGAMLQHHLLASTKYMSRWIEEKNKKP